MNSHLVHIPSFRAFTTRGLSCSDFKMLRWQTDWTLYTEILALCTLDELRADLLERLDIARSESDADFVDFLSHRN